MAAGLGGPDGIGAAALPFLNQTLVSQKLQGVSDRLAAHLIAGGQGLLRGQLLPAVPVHMIPPEDLSQLLVFGCHRSPSFLQWCGKLFSFIIAEPGKMQTGEWLTFLLLFVCFGKE